MDHRALGRATPDLAGLCRSYVAPRQPLLSSKALQVSGAYFPALGFWLGFRVHRRKPRNLTAGYWLNVSTRSEGQAGFPCSSPRAARFPASLSTRADLFLPSMEELPASTPSSQRQLIPQEATSTCSYRSHTHDFGLPWFWHTAEAVGSSTGPLWEREICQMCQNYGILMKFEGKKNMYSPTGFSPCGFQWPNRKTASLWKEKK